MRRLRVIAIIAAVAALFVITGAAWMYRWSSPPTYTPAAALTLAAPIRTSAEHDAFMRDRDWPYILRLDGTPAGGALLYYGSRHTKDPGDPQVREIVRLWDEFQPTVALCESRLGFFVGGLSHGVSQFGEPAAAFALARRDGIPIYTLEPDFAQEIAHVRREFPADEVCLFYTLRMFMSERAGASDLDALASSILVQRNGLPGIENSLPDLGSMDALWGARYAALGDWRTLPDEALWPGAEHSPLNRMANLSNEFRDLHQARALIDLVQRGERIFAICGGSHVVKQEPPIRAALVPSSDPPASPTPGP